MGMQGLTVVLLPGIDGLGKMFGPLKEYLDPVVRTQVIAYPPDRRLSYPQLAEQVRQQLPSGPFCIIAESYAGPLALHLCREPGLAALVLCCTFVSNPRPWLARLARPFLWRWVLGIKPSHWMARFFVTGPSASDELLEHVLAFRRVVDTGVFRDRLLNVFAVDMRQALRDCPVPLLHLHAKHDRVVLPYSTKEIRQVRPDIPSVQIDGPHYLLQMAPSQCAEVILPFLETHAVPG
jgi:pimeloyl-ACP methyl ester carboxylesterase